MMLFENIKMAIESIKINRMRSFLTMLGIIIGITSVIVIVAAGDGAKESMMSSFQDIGASTLMVSVNAQNAEQGDQISMEDLDAIQGITGVAAVSPAAQAVGQVAFEHHDNFAIINGTSPDFESIQQVEMVSGRFFSQEDYQAERGVVVLDDLTARKFFGTSNVVGMSVNLTISGANGRSTLKCKIVGVAKSPYASYGMDFDGMPGMLYIPFTTLSTAQGGGGTVDSLYVRAEAEEQKDMVSTSVRSLLEARHNARGRSVYVVQDLMQQVDMMNSMIGMITTFVAAVAAISLLVGGVGVMNIMLVSVSERTREIGIRKALGAKTGAILQQFLTESVILSLIGGVIGLVLGYLGALGICSLINVTPVFSVGSIVITLVFSASVGIFFGIYPARQAARMSPIEALRHE